MAKFLMAKSYLEQGRLEKAQIHIDFLSKSSNLEKIVLTGIIEPLTPIWVLYTTALLAVGTIFYFITQDFYKF